jgi:UDP-N-acetylmuramyl pentapeptide phosphotransferase/UDP-N-acetylglucosamine-1-phosphate transferase
MIPAVVASAVVACLATYAVLRWLPQYGFVDVPNERSSHDTPTATLGGAGILLGFLTGCVVYAHHTGEVAWETGGVVAVAGTLALFARDEIRPLGRLTKLAIQGIAAALAVHLFGSLESLTLPLAGTLALSGWGPILTWFIYVTGQNIFNFMDGIDGLAGSEGLLAAAAFAVLLGMVHSVYAPLPALIAGACLGFLVWNLPSARVFMGDIGGHLLGLMLGAFVVLSERSGIPIWLAATVVGTFLFDGVYTISRRALRGENITMAHRFHLYQRLVRIGWSHLVVDIVYGIHTVVFAAGVVAYVSGHRPFGFGLIATGLFSMTVATVLIERRWLQMGETS